MGASLLEGRELLVKQERQIRHVLQAVPKRAKLNVIGNTPHKSLEVIGTLKIPTKCKLLRSVRSTQHVQHDKHAQHARALVSWMTARENYRPAGQTLSVRVSMRTANLSQQNNKAR